MQQNYEISCMVTIRSKNPDSFMFQSQGIDMTRLQSKSFSIPLIEEETEGQEEEELKDLKSALKNTKEKYGIEGVVSGALYSNYQRKRIEKVCDSLGLKIFAPLWHINQEKEMREILKKGFKFMVVKISADGLDKSWLGKVITEDDIDKLVKLDKKIGFNVAFEGGEAETLMIDGPIFKKRIEIIRAEKILESEHLGVYEIHKAKLV